MIPAIHQAELADLLRQHVPYEAINGRLYCKNRDCLPATPEDDQAWDWAAHVADMSVVIE